MSPSNIEIYPPLWSKLVRELTGTFPHDALLVQSFCEIFHIPERVIAAKMIALRPGRGA